MKCPLCNGTGVMKARDRAEEQNGLNDVYAGDPYPCTSCCPRQHVERGAERRTFDYCYGPGGRTNIRVAVSPRRASDRNADRGE